jgi:hypothetical protein
MGRWPLFPGPPPIHGTGTGSSKAERTARVVAGGFKLKVWHAYVSERLRVGAAAYVERGQRSI